MISPKTISVEDPLSRSNTQTNCNKKQKLNDIYPDMHTKTIDIKEINPRLIKKILKGNRLNRVVLAAIDSIAPSKTYTIIFDRDRKFCHLQTDTEIYSLDRLNKITNICIRYDIKTAAFISKDLFINFIENIYHNRKSFFVFQDCKIEKYNLPFTTKIKKTIFGDNNYINFNAVTELLKKGDYHKAHALMSIIYRKTPEKNCAIVTLYAETLEYIGELDEAIRIMTAYEDYRDDKFNITLSALFIKKYDYVQAYEAIRQICHQTKNTIETKLYILNSLHSYEKTITEFEKNPVVTDITLISVTKALIGVKKFHEALQMLNKIDQKYDIYKKTLLATILLGLGKPHEVVNMFSAEDIEKDDSIKAAYSRALYQIGELDQALDTLNKIKEKNQHLYKVSHAIYCLSYPLVQKPIPQEMLEVNCAYAVMDSFGFTRHSLESIQNKCHMNKEIFRKHLEKTPGILIQELPGQNHYKWIGIIEQNVMEVLFAYSDEQNPKIITIIPHFPGLSAAKKINS